MLLLVPEDNYVPVCYLWGVLIDIQIDSSFFDSWCCDHYSICCFLMFDHEITLVWYCSYFRATICYSVLPPTVILFVVWITILISLLFLFCFIFGTSLFVYLVGIQTIARLVTLWISYGYPVHIKRAGSSFEFYLSITLVVIWISRTVAGSKN